jgi:hypothetical protein
MMRSESNSFLKQLGASMPTDEEREAARREVIRRGGRDTVWERLREAGAEKERLGQDLRTELRRNGLRAMLPMLDVPSYERLLLATGRIEVTRLAPERQKLGALPAGAEAEVRAVVQECGRGTYRITYPAVHESEERSEALEFAGVPKAQDVMEVLTAYGLSVREGP